MARINDQLQPSDKLLSVFYILFNVSTATLGQDKLTSCLTFSAAERLSQNLTTLVTSSTCDYDSTTELRCTTLPTCFRTITLFPQLAGPNITSLPSHMLNATGKSEYIDSLVVKGFQHLEEVGSGLTWPYGNDLVYVTIFRNPQLTFIHEEAFKGSNINLAYLTISENSRLSNLTFLVEVHMRALVKLDLSRNTIKLLPCGIFNYMDSLEWLILRENQLIFVDECYLGRLLSIRPYNFKLDLRNNPLECNCSMLPMYSGLTAMLRHTFNDTLCLAPFKLLMPTTLGLLSNPELVNVSCDISKDYRNLSGCECIPEPENVTCPPICIGLTKFSTKRLENICMKELEDVNFQGFWEKKEGCMCVTLVRFLDIPFGTSWGDNYCQQRGQLASHLRKQTWTFWLLGVAGFLILIAGPFFLSVRAQYHKFTNKKTESDEEEVSLDESDSETTEKDSASQVIAEDNHGSNILKEDEDIEAVMINYREVDDDGILNKPQETNELGMRSSVDSQSTPKKKSQRSSSIDSSTFIPPSPDSWRE